MKMKTTRIPGPLERIADDEYHYRDYPVADVAGKKIVFATLGGKIQRAELTCNGIMIANCAAPSYMADWTEATVTLLDMTLEAPYGILQMRIWHEPGKIISLRIGTYTQPTGTV